MPAMDNLKFEVSTGAAMVSIGVKDSLSKMGAELGTKLDASSV
jgi:hypothetical protein